MFLGRKLTYMFTHLTYPPSYTYPHIPHPHIPTLTCTPSHTHPHTYTLTHTLTYPPSHIYPHTHIPTHTYSHFTPTLTHPPHIPTHSHFIPTLTYPLTSPYPPSHTHIPTQWYSSEVPNPSIHWPPNPPGLWFVLWKHTRQTCKVKVHGSSYLHQLFQHLTCLRSYCSVCICSIPPWLVNISLTYLDKWYIPPHVVDWSMYPTLWYYFFFLDNWNIFPIDTCTFSWNRYLMLWYFFISW